MIVPAGTAPDEPGGVIVYRTGDGLRTVSGLGRPLALRPAEPNVPNYGDGVFRSPDGGGGASAWVVPEAGGFVLEVFTAGTLLYSTPIAGEGDPGFVSNGKSAARAAGAIPLVVAWSPDGARLAYGSVSGAPWTLHVVELSGRSTTSHALEGGYVGDLAWAPDSSRLAFSTYTVGRTDHTLLILDVGTGAVRQLAKGCVVVWSPDSRSVALHGEPASQPGIWVIAADGSERLRVVAEERAFPVAWTG